MKYIKYFESVNSESVLELLKSCGFHSKDELTEIIQESFLELKDFIQYYNDESDEDFIELQDFDTTEYYFNRYSKENKSNIKINDQILNIDMTNSKNFSLDRFLELINKKFKFADSHFSFDDEKYIIINLIPENLVYYEIYKYRPEVKGSGDYYEIKPLYSIFKDNSKESLRYSQSLVGDFSIKLHHLRNMYDLVFSYSGDVISIRILPK